MTMMTNLVCSCTITLFLVSSTSAQGLFPPIFPNTGEFPDVLPENFLAFIFNNRDALLPTNRAACNTAPNTGTNLEGTCLHNTECTLSAGMALSRGNCTFGSTCCTYQKTCGQTDRSRVAYFITPGTPRLATDRTCALHVQTINENICQIRVDIINMVLSPPTVGAADANGNALVTCTNDQFRVNPQPTVQVPPLCGTNTNTHFYIHLSPGQRNVDLEMFLRGTGTAGVAAVNPSWNLKVTQLECPSLERKLDLNKKKENPNQAFLDRGLIAPEGCLQYYTDPTGVVKSFGFATMATATGDSTLTTGQNYAACFRNSANCGVTFNVNRMQDLFLRDMTNMCLQAWVTVPEVNPPVDGKVCEMSVTTFPATLNSQHPGPAYLHVDIVNAQPATINGGFQFPYMVNNNC